MQRHGFADYSDRNLHIVGAHPVWLSARTFHIIIHVGAHPVCAFKNG